MGQDRAAAARLAPAVHDQIVAVDLDLDAVRPQTVGDGGEPIGFLDAQFLEPTHHRGALGEARGDCQDRVFVDHGRRARGRHLDSPQRRSSDAEIRHLLAAVAAHVERLDIGPHLAQRDDQPGAQRIGHDVGEDDLRARDD